ncbi:MAG: hypothetical protein FWE08_03305 [Oscillospiraceae bacterium]|nr:hypothetical protein [Oscillospiraceae bacterium]
MKGMKLIITLASALVVLSAAVVAVVIFQEELTKFFCSCRDYCTKTLGGKKDEYSDFADV